MVTLLVERGADINLAVEGDGNPLIAASQRGALDVVRYLLDRGADINAIVPGDENALINASANGHLPVVQLLVERGANVNAGVWKENARQARDGSWSTSPEYRTPLSSALRGGHREVVEFLRAHGATN
jgi:ankyrin repeat protein